MRPILRKGGEITLGLAYSLGKSKAYIEKLFAHRFKLNDPFARSELEQFAEEGAKFGSLISGLAESDLIPLETFPVNPELFGGESEGNRILTVSDVSADGGQVWLQRRIRWPDQPTMQELADELAKALQGLLEAYPGQFGALTKEDQEEPAFRHHFGERLF